MQTTERIKRIEGIICKAADITHEELYSRERSRPLVDARHAVWLLLYEHVGYSYNDIARLYGKDHTTIAHGVRRIKRTVVHGNILKGINKIDSKLLIPLVENRKLRPSETWEFGCE